MMNNSMTNHVAFLLAEGAPADVILNAVRNYELKYNAMLNGTYKEEVVEEEEEEIEYIEL